MPEFKVRRMERTEGYAAVAPLLNLIWSEPTTAERLKEEEDSIPPGKLHYNEEGKLMGWDRPQWLAEDEQGRTLAYAIAWRAPWTEPGALICNLVVDPASRGTGIGRAVYEAMRQWAAEVQASRLITYIRENDSGSLSFAERRGCVKERHTFESVLELAAFDGGELDRAIEEAERSGIRFVTLADEPGEASERKLYELYKATHLDNPGYNEDFPWFEEWKKWSIGRPDVCDEWVHIARDGEHYVGVVTLQRNEQTKAMYHEYTGVLREYRGRRLALALKLLGMRTAMRLGVPYLRTHNDSMNAPMLRVNRDLLGFRAEPGQYRMVQEL